MEKMTFPSFSVSAICDDYDRPWWCLCVGKAEIAPTWKTIAAQLKRGNKLFNRRRLEGSGTILLAADRSLDEAKQ
jgi:hypothetical protein